MENHCVRCGKIIPEGLQVCPECEAAAAEDTKGNTCGLLEDD